MNHLEESKIESYVDGTVNMPGYGVNISNASNVKLVENYISLFESGIFAQYSNGLIFDNNTLRENNYGIKYGFGVANTKIINNEISDQTGLFIMTVPEGPTGYGIFLNNSAVNVTINHNHIAHNHLGISLDANYSTGIVITQNTITDNILEGMRFNAGYDLAENAVEPVVTDNAVYRNAVGPSMMILGEMSANPEGIYGPGQWNESLRLKLDPNWYGTNNLVTWDIDTGVVGYGTMCPRISTTAINTTIKSKINKTTFIL
jgi:parallel beta-helix repeat protein